MIAVYLLPVFAASVAYVCFWSLRWLGVCCGFFRKKWVKVVYVAAHYALMACMYVGALLPHGTLEHLTKLIGNYWYGVGLYAGMIVLGATAVRLVLLCTGLVSREKLCTPRHLILSGALCTALIIAVSIGGIVNAKTIHTTRYEVTIPKDGGEVKDLKLVVAGDLHMGHNIRMSQMKKMVERINACDPDIVLIAGDIFDNEFDAVEKPEEMAQILAGIQSKYGVYATYGNHDCEEPIVGGFTFPSKEKKMSDPRMDELVKQAGFILLRDEGVLIDDSFYLYGRPDEERPGRGIDRRLEPEEFMSTMDNAKPILVVEHEPKELDKLDAAGVDLHLAGHTHDGQVFPLNIICDLMWENSCGYLQKDHMQSIVTSGVGLYGPNMRVATIAEICDITVHFE